ncbi:acetate--CoA ligase family protein [Pseudonocardia sp. KRD291]|uniref:acetate--CoA ligase family protein n=1 Tax=Pseudonocardia sp. KRD291 TaxID=2792007 RepID=UPI001C4A2D06|nr:acetate--CoA ligase family protein [Pseudonocardia sp. KRD291]MBW0102410.1 acetate--CoA ligase family protein [Pseudonocardia sp. KRD291]
MTGPAGRATAPSPGTVGALLGPRSIAIVGASDRSRWSVAMHANLTDGGFTGDLHLVNPRSPSAHGRATVPSATAIEVPPDLGVVMVPGPAVLDAVADLGRAGARAALVLTSGFAETGDAGRRLQEDLRRTAADHGVALLGPNSLGFLNLVEGVRVWATPVKTPSAGHGVGIVSQSGAVAYFLTNLAHQQDVGLSHVVATGNEADLDATAVVQYLVDDPQTRAVALFAETVRDPDRFVDVARTALAAGTPIVVLKVGSSEATARSALAHTGALVGDDRVFDAVCEQYGVVRVGSLEDLVATADVLGRTGELRPGGLGVVSNSGGICEIAADLAQSRGVELPEISPRTTVELADALPGYATMHNPLDLTGGIEPDGAGRLVRALGDQDDVAAVLVPYYPVPTTPDSRSTRLTELHRSMGRALRGSAAAGMVVSYHDTVVTDLTKQILAEDDIPYLACGLDRAMGAVARAFRWSERRRAAAVGAGPGAAGDGPAIDERPRSEHEVLDLLARHGVPTVPAGVVTTEDQAVAHAAGLGGPVVLKIASPDIGHKSEIGGVALDVRGADGVREAFRRVAAAGRARPGARIDGVLVAPMRRDGVELFVGFTRDPQWGPVLAIGLGGIWVEVLGDTRLALLPVGPSEIRAMLTRLRGARLLAGERGALPADLDAVAEVIARIGAVALRLGPDLAALEVNPLLVHGDRVEAVDALAVWGADADPGGRHTTTDLERTPT